MTRQAQKKQTARLTSFKMTGIIIKALSGFYYTEADGVIYECKARGSFRKNGISPLVGDRVEIERVSEAQGVLDKILPRKNAVIRPPVANIDKLFIVSSYTNPQPNSLLIDKMTVTARYNSIEPIIVFNKCDMGDFNAWEKKYINAGFKTYTVSAEANIGIEEIKKELANCVTAFTGNSGVGKSSILNRLLGESIKTGDVSEKLGRGRHTTRHTELYKTENGGFVADTPGFSTFELNTSDYELKEKLADCFADFNEYVPYCRFTGCTHTKETGCAVLKAVKDGEIEKTRHNSYLQLFEEMKDLKPWQVKR